MLPYITDLQRSGTAWTFELYFTLSALYPYGSSLFVTDLTYTP